MTMRRNVSRRHRPARTLRPLHAALLVCLSMSQACHTWSRTQLAPTPAFREGQRVRVVRSDGSRTVLVAPRVDGDSLVGSSPGSSTRVAIPVADIRRAERYELNAVRTTLLILAVAGALYLAIGAFAASQMEFDLPLGL